MKPYSDNKKRYALTSQVDQESGELNKEAGVDKEFIQYLSGKMSSRVQVIGYNVNRDPANEKHYKNLHMNVGYYANDEYIPVQKIEASTEQKDLSRLLSANSSKYLSQVLYAVLNGYYKWPKNSKTYSVIEALISTFDTIPQKTTEMGGFNNLVQLAGKYPASDVIKDSRVYEDNHRVYFCAVLVLMSHAWDSILLNPYVEKPAQSNGYLMFLKEFIGEFDKFFNEYIGAVKEDISNIKQFVNTPFFYVSPRQAGNVIATAYKNYETGKQQSSGNKVKVTWNNGKVTHNTEQDIQQFIAANPAYTSVKNSDGSVTMKLQNKQDSTVNPEKPTGAPTISKSSSKPTKQKAQATKDKIMQYSDWSN